MRKIILLIFLCTLAAGNIFAQENTNWAKTAITDLDYMYQMYRDNHVAVVDPENPKFKKKLEKEYKKARKRALKAKTEKEYQAALKSMLTPFKDGHIKVIFNDELNAAGNMYKEDVGYTKPLSLEKFGKNNAWVYIHTLGEEKEEYEKLAGQLESNSDKDIIVLDVRYNGGGMSSNGNIILGGLYGEEYVEAVQEKLMGNMAVFFRVTPWIISKLEEQESVSPEAMKELKEALQKNEEIKRFKIKTDFKYSEIPQTNIKSKVYVLTNGGCFSSCLDFMDMLKTIGNVTQVGRETGADTKYPHVARAYLPSGNGRFLIAIKGWFGRVRDDNETYKPDYVYKGDINDTKTIQNWIIQLDGKRNGR
ncbi:hypothetical protein Dip510_000229 [Elusimicrobium posterum]|uniref:S41 family peptidase n=1 Tax=Elusimicrobium posterum TaxID=3116653 RepID=UPI003C779B42